MSQKKTLSTFENARFGAVRVVMRDGEPWFVAKDVCTCLEIGNSRQAVSYLDDDEKGVISNDTPGGKQEMQVVSEPGLYSLIFRSRKPEAKEFKRWVTHEVLPSIRKTGQYTETDAHRREWMLRRQDGKKLRRFQTDMLQRAGASSPRDYAIPTAILHKAWSGMTPASHKAYKHLGKRDTLRDHCTCTELSMIDLSEHMHCIKMCKTGASTPQEAVACAEDCATPMQRIAQIFSEAIGEPVVSSLNNLPGSEKKAIDVIHDTSALGGASTFLPV